MIENIDDFIPLDIMNVLRLFINSDDILNDDYPRYKRLISVVDRRTITNEEIWIFEPEENCRNISQSLSVHYHWPGSLISLLPAIDSNSKSKTEKNISAKDYCKSSVVTFSFRVKEKDCVNCYVFWGGCMMLLKAEDISRVLFRMFTKSLENEEFLQSQESYSMIEEFGNVVTDEYYDICTETF